MSYVCSTCGESHEDIPLSFAADYPDPFANMSSEERENCTVIGSDQCIIDEEAFYIRGCLEIPITDGDEIFLWGLWARVHEADFDEISESWEQIGREKLHGPFKGRLANELSEYPNTLNLKLTVTIQPVGERPLFTLDAPEHPLAIAQAYGMSKSEVHELVSRLMHRLL